MQIHSPDAQNLAKAVQLIREGKLVCFPTETVYGLGADATSDAAVAAIFDAKKRDTQNRLALLAGSIAQAEKIAVVDERARLLANHYWPGPLTLILPLKMPSSISSLVTAGSDTIGVRIPNHPVALSLLHALEGPLVGTSANISGMPSAVTASQVAENLGNKVDMIIDGGKCDIGIASTIIDLSLPVPRLLRQGSITTSQIERLVGKIQA